MSSNFTKKLRFVIVTLGIAVGLTQVMFVGSASAKTGNCFFPGGAGPSGLNITVGSGGTCSVPGNGLYGTNDVLTGRTGPGGRAIPGNVNNKNSFKNHILNRFNNGNSHDKIGSAFIIQEMRPGGSHAWPSAADVATWTSLMDDSSVTFSRNNKSVGRTSYFDTQHNNPFYTSHTTVTRDVITIRQGDRVVAEIETECGNMVAGNSGFTLPEWNLDANSSVSSNVARPGQKIDFLHTVINRGPDDMDDPLTFQVRWSNSGSPLEAPSAGQRGAVIRTCNRPGGLDNGAPPVNCHVTNFTIPTSATTGQKYCQFIRYGRENRRAGATTDNAKICVTVHKPIAACDASMFPTSADAGTNFVGKLGVRVGLGGTPLTGPHSINYTIRGPLPGASTNINRTENTNPTADIAIPNIAPGSYAVSWRYSGGTALGPNTVTIPSPGPPPVSECRLTLEVQAKPYVSVLGGDIKVGGGFSYIYKPASTPANPNPAPQTKASSSTYEGNLFAYNTSVPNYKGAGTQLAAIVHGVIEEFTSRNFQTAGLPTALTFANTTGATWGGDFVDLHEINNYWAPVDRGEAMASGPSPIGPMTLTDASGIGEKRTMYVDGDVTINGNIVYAKSDGGWSSVAMVPNFRIIARGNIYIQPNVEQLDGTYIALPRIVAATGDINPNTGRIYTCAIGAGVPNTDQLLNQCNRRLVINGAFIAKQVKLLRTINAIGNAEPCISTYAEADCRARTSRAAEIFNYSPDVWMSAPSHSISGSRKFDAITSLPPVL